MLSCRSVATVSPERLLVERPLLVVIGPSASGKSGVVRELDRRGVIRVHPTWTTRPCRDDEADVSVEHRFVSDAVFEQLSSAGSFVDTVSLFGLAHRYGLPPITVSRAGPIDTVMLRAPLVARMAGLVPRCLVYQICDTGDRTGRRLVARGSPAAEVAARVADNRCEETAGRLIADRVFVNDGPLAALVDAVAAALAIDVPRPIRPELDRGIR